MTTFNTSIAAGADDFSWITGAGFGNTETTTYLGRYLGTYTVLAGYRFTGVTVPNGATITNAYLTFTSYSALSAAVTLTIWGVDADNQAAPTSEATAAAMVETSASVSWSPGAWAAGSTYNTNDISSIIQEIVDRAGWASGNALVIEVFGPASGSGYRLAHTYDYGSGYPQLTIEYVVAAEATADITLGDVTLSATSTAPVSLATGFTFNIQATTLSATAVGPTASAEADITLDDLTLASTATVDVQGAASITLDDLTLASTAEVPVQAAASITLDDVTLSSTAEVPVQATASITLDALTLSATFTSASSSASADADITLADLTLSATATTGDASTPLAALIEIDSLRDGTYSGTYDDISAYVMSVNWRNGMSDAYQEVAPPARATFTLKDPDGDWRQDWRGSEALSHPTFDSWTAGDPDGWFISGESGTNPEVSEVGVGELHGGTGSNACNIYTTGTSLYMQQTALTVGTRYEVIMTIDIVDETKAGGIYVQNGATVVSKLYNRAGVKRLFFTATDTRLRLQTSGACDITLNSVYCKPTKKYCGVLNKSTLIRVKMQAPYVALTTMYIGQIVDAKPAFGEWGQREVTITAECPMLRLLDAEYQPSLLLNATTDQVIAQIFDTATIPYPYGRDYWTLGLEGLSVLGTTTYLYDHSVTALDTGNTTLPYAGDSENQTGKGIKAQGVIRSMMAAELGRFYFDTRNAQFTMHNRHRDILNNTAAAAFTLSDFWGGPETAADDTANRITLNYEPRAVGAPGEVIWTAAGLPLKLNPGEHKQLTARYVDPDSDKPMGAMEFIPPLLGLDYTATTDEEGSGTDISNKVTVGVEFGGSSATVWLDSSVTCYVQVLQLRGTPLRRFDRQSLTESDGDSYYDSDWQDKSIDIPAISDEDFARNVAKHYLARHSERLTRLASVTLLSSYDNGTAAGYAVNYTVGDRITITDSFTQHDLDYFIVGETHSIQAGSAPTWTIKWALRPASREVFWRVGISGYSELGETTRITL